MPLPLARVLRTEKSAPEVGVVVVGDFGDQHLDQHLGHGPVQLVDDRLDLVFVFGGGGDQQGVGVGVGDDEDLAGELVDEAAVAAAAGACRCGCRCVAAPARAPMPVPPPAGAAKAAEAPSATEAAAAAAAAATERRLRRRQLLPKACVAGCGRCWLSRPIPCRWCCRTGC